MKKNYWMASAAMCALALATTISSCSNDDTENATTGKGQRFIATANIPTDGADTRISHTENATDVTLKWNSTDAFGVWKAGETTVNAFTTAITEESSKADFTCATASFTDNDPLYAVYPTPTVVATNNKVSLDLSAAQTGLLEQGNIHYMYASAVAKNNTADFNFKHAVSVVKLTLTLPAGAGALTSVTFMAAGLHNKATLDMAAATAPTITGTDAGSITATGSFNDGASVYLYVFPGTLTGVTVMATDGTTNYEASLSDKTLVAGRVYKAPITMAVIDNTKFANENEVDGSTPEKAYEINTAERLLLLANRIAGSETNKWNTKCYKLTANIDLAAAKICGDASTMGGAAKNWVTIGINSSSKYFKGQFDGNGYTVSGLYIDAITTDYQGLFGRIENATIKNLNVSGTVKGEQKVGGIIGRGNNSIIENCSFAGSVSGTVSIGGIIGQTDGGILLKACSNKGNVTFSTMEGGGIMAGTRGTLIGCYNLGNVGTKDSAGGIVGALSGDEAVRSCYSTGTVTGTTNYAKIIGSFTKGSCDYVAYLTGGFGSVTDGSGGTMGTHTQGVSNMNTQDICDFLNEGITDWNANSTTGTTDDKYCNYHYEVGTGSNTTPVLVAGAPQ